MFLGYSTKRKAYKCLNTNTNKIVESTNVKFDELAEFQNDECTKKPKGYNSFVYFYEGMTDKGDVENQIVNHQRTSLSVES